MSHHDWLKGVHRHDRGRSSLTLVEVFLSASERRGPTPPGLDSATERVGAPVVPTAIKNKSEAQIVPPDGLT